MASIALAEFLPEVLPHVSGCADTLAANAVRNAIIQFCTETLVWNEGVDQTPVEDSDFPWYLDAVSGAIPVKVMSLSVNGVPLNPVAMDTIESKSDWFNDLASVPRCYSQPSIDRVILYPRLSDRAVLQLRVAYAPKRVSETAPKWLHEYYLEDIANGALSRLLRIKGQPWTDFELGLVYREAFERAISRVSAEVSASFGRTELAIEMRPFV